MPQVNPEIVRWARLTAGLSEAEAADKVGLKPARGHSAEERLRAIEEGADAPSRPLILRMSKAYRRPLLTFYMPRPPRVVSRGQDFRHLPDEDSAEEEPVLDALLRDIQARQAMVRAAIEDEGSAPPIPYVGSATLADSVETLVASMRQQLNVSLDQYRDQRNAEEAFTLLRSGAEDSGAFVLLVGDLGSHHTALDVEVFRGFALADPVAPFVVVNDRDARAAWSFTLLHELAHIWLGQTGVSGGTPDQNIERFCNDVASEYLLPSSEAARFTVGPALGTEELAASIDAAASGWRVSSSLVAYKLYRVGTINLNQWRDVRRLYRQRWLGVRERRRSSDSEKTGGPNYYVVRRHRLGSHLLNTTARLMSTGDLTTSKAARILGVKPHQVTPLVYGAARSARAS